MSIWAAAGPGVGVAATADRFVAAGAWDGVAVVGEVLAVVVTRSGRCVEVAAVEVGDVPGAVGDAVVGGVVAGVVVGDVATVVGDAVAGDVVVGGAVAAVGDAAAVVVVDVGVGLGRRRHRT